MTQGRPELRALTSARGLAAWFVVLFHVRLSTLDLVGPTMTSLFNHGYLAVDFFFMLSGFVIWLNYADRLRDRGLAEIPAFLWRRLARIYPLHLFVLSGAVAFAIAHVVAGKPLPPRYQFDDLFYHVLLIQNWGIAEKTMEWNVPAWSISCEFAAYLAFPLLAMSVNWRRWHSALLVALLVAVAGLLHLLMRHAGVDSLGAYISRVGLIRCFCEFAMGTIICELWSRWRATPLRPALAGAATALVGVLWFLDGGPETFSLPIAFAGMLILLALTAELPGNPLAHRVLHYLGEISYATYLVHYLLFVAFKLMFVDESLSLGAGQLAAYLAMTLVASILLYHGVERPAQRWLNRRMPVRWQPERRSFV